LQFNEYVADENFDLYTNITNNSNVLDTLGVPVKRYSEDTKCNNYGRRIIDMCTHFDIHIVNGRCGKDSYVGEFSTVKRVF